MKEKQVELFHGFTVSKSIADWIRLMYWEGIMNSIGLAITGVRDHYTKPKRYMNNILGLYWDETQSVYKTKDVKSLILTTNLDQIILTDEKILPSYLIGQEFNPSYKTN